MHSFFNKSRNLRNKLSPNHLSSDSTPPPAALDELARPVNSSQLFSNNPPHDNHSDSELQLIYGYIGLYTEVEIDLLTTARAVNLVAQELKSRALETPLLFSTHALDISTEGTHSLIRRFVHDQNAFAHDLIMHSPHNLAAFLKWLLARCVNGRGAHGILTWEQYASWRESEKAFGYPPDFLSTHFLAQLAAPTASLLSCLLDLFASASVRADLNGMTPHKCGALFGAYIFGLEDDKPFEQTYSHWLRQSHATEHMIFAFMRDLKAQSPTGKLPSRMETTIQGYPSIIPSLIKTHPTARLERVVRFQRLTSSYSKNLIASAGTWNVARSKTWDRLKPYPEIGAAQYLNHSKSGHSTDPSKLLFSPSYKHLLNIKGQMNDENEDIDQLGANFEGPQRFKTLVEKEWSGFLNRGFQEPDAKKLQFNLDESSNAKLKAKRETMDWDSFMGAGFLGRETFQATDLDFDASIQHTAPPPISPPTSKRIIPKKLTKTSRNPTAFPYDTTPIELSSLFVDENFFEAWADVLVSSGWSRDDPKEVRWVLIYCKCKPADYQEFEFRPTALNPDGRNDDKWALFEEVVPPEYQAAQLNASKSINNRHHRRSFLRVITRKENKRSQNGSTSEKAPPTPGSPFNFYPMAPESQAPTMSNSNSQYSNSHSSYTYQATACDSPSTRAASTTPHSGHAGGSLLRSLSKMIQGGQVPVNVSDARYPARFQAKNRGMVSVDALSPPASQETPTNSSELRVASSNPSRARSTRRPALRSAASSDTTHGMSTSSHLHKSNSTHFDRPPNPTPPSSDPRESSSSISTPDHSHNSDQEQPAYDHNRSSAISRSIASSSDFTVEMVERLPERSFPAVRGPLLVPMYSYNNSTSPRPTRSKDPIDSATQAYDSSHLATPRTPTHGDSLAVSQSAVSSPPSVPSGDQMRHHHHSSPHMPTGSQVGQQLSDEPVRVHNRRQRPERLILQQQQNKEQHPLQSQEPTPMPNAPHHAHLGTHYQRTEHPLQQQQQPASLEKQREGLLSPHLAPPVSPLFSKSALRKVELHNSGSSIGSFESPGSKDEEWHLPLRKSALGPVASNYQPTRPILPPQFDIKAKKVSNIVDLFEKALPDSPLRENDSRSLAYAMPSSPIRIPVRSLKLSRVGEQEE
ncbi:hypothetical protein PCASD_13481 [Puccinia coronata f. sp. avenae]|uniref:Meiotically up-regulated protein Msb1/Mug8 domain-containing protein n=1 Tax=Puccinia coronata f. sp. avenae TaxID=200324 RepID=A0A2N5TES6_9BASI|nr:hypothetical protein PCASD_13481 [Puccinia coronata f. sp. avenae]